MKIFYTIKRRESGANIGNFRQEFNTPLSDNAIKQSGNIDKRLKKYILTC